MKHLRILGLAIVAVLAITAWAGAGTASATELYKYTTPSANDTLGVGTEITATIKSGTSLLMQNTIQSTVSTCVQGEMRLKTESAGGAGSHPSGKVSAIGFGQCNQLTNVANGGEIEFQHIAGTTNAKVIWKNFETSFSHFGLPCTAKSGPEAEAGTLTGATSATGHATLDLNMPLSFLLPNGETCGDGHMTGTFTITTPTGLIVEEK
jgi:hypothetical protein